MTITIPTIALRRALVLLIAAIAVVGAAVTIWTVGASASVTAPPPATGSATDDLAARLSAEQANAAALLGQVQQLQSQSAELAAALHGARQKVSTYAGTVSKLKGQLSGGRRVVVVAGPVIRSTQAPPKPQATPKRASPKASPSPTPTASPTEAATPAVMAPVEEPMPPPPTEAPPATPEPQQTPEPRETPEPTQTHEPGDR